MKIKTGDCVYHIPMKKYGIVVQKGILPNTWVIYIETKNPDHAKNGYQWLTHKTNLLVVQ